ncbi:hypothetical protein NKI88_31200 [Mesorhizobium sp. M0317]|uniref:hypothetical protein n=1 Tax=unclassified Mesorhizobium TaxID=325217 RepID=UPI00333B9A95
MVMVVETTVDEQRAASRFTKSFTIKNQTDKPISKAALAWCDYAGEPIWGDVLDFPRNIAPGRSGKVTFKTKVQVVKAYIKWFENGQRKTMEMERVPFFGNSGWPYYYFIEFELVVDDILGPYIGKLISAPIPADA